MPSDTTNNCPATLIAVKGSFVIAVALDKDGTVVATCPYLVGNLSVTGKFLCVSVCVCVCVWVSECVSVYVSESECVCVYVCEFLYMYKFILHAPLQDCNTTCNGVFLNNKQYIH